MTTSKHTTPVQSNANHSFNFSNNTSGQLCLPNSKHIERPRIMKLLKNSINYPITTISAGPGYGKTTAVSSFVRQNQFPYIWLTLSIFDNVCPAFWDKVETVTRAAVPKLADIIHETDFPDTLEALAEFKEKISASVKGIDRLIIIIDNYELLTNAQILSFLNQFICFNYDPGFSVHFILISNQRFTNTHNPLSKEFQNIGEYNCINANDLAFEIDEIQQVLPDSASNHNDAANILALTDGWPIYISLLQNGYSTVHSMMFLFEFFENQYFSTFSDEKRTLLIRLSLLPGFSLEMVKGIYSGGITELFSEIIDNIFVDFDYETQLFSFQKIYKKFLSYKTAALSHAQKITTLQVCGDYFFKTNHFQEAANMYIASTNYKMLAKCLNQLHILDNSSGLSPKLQKTLAELPGEVLNKNPWLAFHLAYNHLYSGKIVLAKSLFLDLLKMLENRNNPKDTSLIGEICRMLAFISTLRNEMDGMGYMEKAVKCMLSERPLLNRRNPITKVDPVFFLPSDPKITVPDMINYMHELTLCGIRIYQDNLLGYEYLFHAEGSLLICNYKDAQSYSRLAIYKAQSLKQHDIVMAGYYHLLRLHISVGNYKDAVDILDESHTYVKKNRLKQYSSFQDIIDALFFLQVRLDNSIAPWIRNIESPFGDPSSLPARHLYICLLYSINRGNYPLAFSIISKLEFMFQEKKLWSLKAYCYVIESIAYYNMNNPDKALKKLYLYYLMTHEREIIFPLLELCDLIKPVIKLARTQDTYAFDISWLDNVDFKIKEQLLVRQKFMGAYAKDSHNNLFSIRLTKREKQTLKLLSQGLTRVEIAETLDISINGVKKHLSNIYKKLGAANNVDAVNLALQENLI